MMAYKNNTIWGIILATVVVAGCQAPSAPPPVTPIHAPPTPPATQNSAVSTPAPPTPANPVLINSTEFGKATSEQILAALQQLSADDFQTRQLAVANLQKSLVKQMQQTVLVQEVMLKIQQNMGEQLRQMTLVGDPEAQNRVAGLMEFNLALSRWSIDTFNLPPDKRDPMFQWGLSPQGYDLVAKAYARKSETRIAAIKDLAKLKDAPSTALLSMLLQDTNREVSLAAMDALWDRPLTDENLTVIWNKAIGFAIQQNRPRASTNKIIVVHGRAINYYDQEANYQINNQESEVAADLLVEAKSPKVLERLDAFFKEISDSLNDTNDYRWRMLSPNYGNVGQSLNKLLEAYKPKSGVLCTIKILQQGQNSNRQDGYVNQINNKNYYQSPLVDAAFLFLQLTGEDPTDYKITKVMNYGNRPMLEVDAKQGDQVAGAKEERKMIRKILVWWQDHYQEYGAAKPPKPPKEEVDKPATTEPAAVIIEPAG